MIGLYLDQSESSSRDKRNTSHLLLLGPDEPSVKSTYQCHSYPLLGNTTRGRQLDFRMFQLFIHAMHLSELNRHNYVTSIYWLSLSRLLHIYVYLNTSYTYMYWLVYDCTLHVLFLHYWKAHSVNLFSFKNHEKQ